MDGIRRLETYIPWTNNMLMTSYPLSSKNFAQCMGCEVFDLTLLQAVLETPCNILCSYIIFPQKYSIPMYLTRKVCKAKYYSCGLQLHSALRERNLDWKLPINLEYFLFLLCAIYLIFNSSFRRMLYFTDAAKKAISLNDF